MGAQYSEKFARAQQFVETAHQGQLDFDRRTYANRLNRIATNVILYFPNEVDLACAALLQDTLTKTQVTYAQLQAEFGENVALLVEEVTVLGDSFAERVQVQVSRSFSTFATAIILGRLHDEIWNRLYRVADHALYDNKSTQAIFKHADALLHRVLSQKWEDARLMELANCVTNLLVTAKREWRPRRSPATR